MRERGKTVERKGERGRGTNRERKKKVVKRGGENGRLSSRGEGERGKAGVRRKSKIEQ